MPPSLKEKIVKQLEQAREPHKLAGVFASEFQYLVKQRTMRSGPSRLPNAAKLAQEVNDFRKERSAWPLRRTK